MLKKKLVSIVLILVGQCALAKEVPISVSSLSKVTTSNIELKEGDSLDFSVAKDFYLGSKLYLKKGEKVSGIITTLEPNGFACVPASLYVENFNSKSADGEPVSLSGVIYQQGKTHWMLTQFIPILPEIIRGGEVQIKKGDVFTLYFEDNL